MQPLSSLSAAGAITIFQSGQKNFKKCPFFISHLNIICCQVTVALQSPQRIISPHLLSELSDISTTGKKKPSADVTHPRRMCDVSCRLDFYTSMTHCQGKFTLGYS